MNKVCGLKSIQMKRRKCEFENRQHEVNFSYDEDTYPNYMSKQCTSQPEKKRSDHNLSINICVCVDLSYTSTRNY